MHSVAQMAPSRDDMHPIEDTYQAANMITKARDDKHPVANREMIYLHHIILH
jgi:hypothetical protein